jgi:hypothetical protein
MASEPRSQANRGQRFNACGYGLKGVLAGPPGLPIGVLFSV